MLRTMVLAALFAGCHVDALSFRDMSQQGSRLEAELAANPIKRVVVALENTLKEVKAEGEKKDKAHEEFQCACKKDIPILEEAVAAAATKGPELEASIKAKEAEKAQLVIDVNAAIASRSEANKAISAQNAIRSKQLADSNKETSDMRSNIEATGKAITAIEKGTSASFLQSASASLLRRLAISEEMSDANRDLMTSFLSQGQGQDQGAEEEYAPQSGEILGILKELKKQMETDLTAADKASEEALKTHEGLLAAKDQEVAQYTETISNKNTRIAELTGDTAREQGLLNDINGGSGSDAEALRNRKKACEDAAAAYSLEKQQMAEEEMTLGQVIKILEDEKALDVFSKTLPPASASLLQVKVRSAHFLEKARAVLTKKRSHHLDLIAMAMHSGKKEEKTIQTVIRMIDDMTNILKEEQKSEDKSKTDCTTGLGSASSLSEQFGRAISEKAKDIDAANEQLQTFEANINAQEEKIKQIDETTAREADERKKDHETNYEELGRITECQEILKAAKQKLNEQATKFTSGGGIFGVLEMLDKFEKELETRATTINVEEERAQKDYEAEVASDARLREAEDKTLQEFAESKAAVSENLATYTGDQSEAKKSKTAQDKLHQQLLGQCSKLLDTYDARKEARDGEIESLRKAKAILQGAEGGDFGAEVLVQMSRNVQRHLRATASK